MIWELTWTPDLRVANDDDVLLWGREDDEHLKHTELDAAILARIEAGDVDADSTIILGGFRRLRLSRHEPAAERILQGILEDLNDRYGSPRILEDDLDEGYAPPPVTSAVPTPFPTPTMRLAAEHLAAVVREEYRAWGCRQVIRLKVPVRAWFQARGFTSALAALEAVTP